MDETGLFYELQPSKTLSQTAKKSGTKQSKKRVSVVLCTNFDGSDKVPLMVIGKSSNPRCFKNFNVNSYVDYRSNKKAWVTANIFNDWLELFDQRMRSQKKQAILILDNAPGHAKLIETTNTRLSFLPSNMTSWIQPLDAGVINNLKSFYKSKLIAKSIECYDKGLMFKIDMRDCIILLTESWILVKKETIFNCFKHCDIKKIPQSINDGELYIGLIDLEKDIQKLSARYCEEMLEAKSYVAIEEDLEEYKTHVDDQEIIDQVLGSEKECEESSDENVCTVEEKTSHEDALSSVHCLFSYFSQQEGDYKKIIYTLYEMKSAINSSKLQVGHQTKISNFFQKNKD